MDNELEILKNIDNHKRTTQRDIARNTGMSLGSVNILIKRLLNKGLLKMERLNPRTIRYILTPKGVKEKAEATYRYVLRSYKFINEVDQQIENILNNKLIKEFSEIVLFGDKDEILELITNKIKKTSKSYRVIRDIKELKDLLARVDNVEMQGKKNCQLSTVNCQLILTWHPDYSEILEKEKINYINLFENM